jgi:hypothetical protein
MPRLCRSNELLVCGSSKIVIPAQVGIRTGELAEWLKAHPC